MLKGGYKIIDLHGKNISADAVTIPNIYEEIEGNYYKPLLLSGIVISDIERADVFISVISNSGNYVISIYGGTITITPENTVTFTA